jgi:hypothetical protein
MKLRILEILIVLAIAFVILPGCTPQQIKADVEAKVVHDAAVAVTPVAAPDLQAAAAAAAAHGDTDGATCANEVLAYLTTLSTTQSASGLDQLSGIKGIATAIEAQRIAATAPAATIPPVPRSLITGCAVVVFDLKVSLAQFLTQLGFDAGKIIGGGKIGSAQTLSLVKAAEAAQAVKP